MLWQNSTSSLHSSLASKSSAGGTDLSGTCSLLSGALSGSVPTRWSLWRARSEAAEDPAGAYECMIGGSYATTGWSRAGLSPNSNRSSSAPGENGERLSWSSTVRKQFACPGWNPPPVPCRSRAVSRPKPGRTHLDSVHVHAACNGVLPSVVLKPQPPSSPRGTEQKHQEGLSALDPLCLESREIFEELCVRKYTCLIRAWRLHLDAKGVGRISFHAFCDVCRSLGFKDVGRVWAALDNNRSGFISLEEWDPVSFQNLMEFRCICYREYGGMDIAFDLGLDTTRSRTATLSHLQSFCERNGFRGKVNLLMQALDVHQNGFFTAVELDFLTKWQGERSLKTTPHFEIKAARLWAPPMVRKRSRKKPVMLPSMVTGTSSPHSVHMALTQSQLACRLDCDSDGE